MWVDTHRAIRMLLASAIAVAASSTVGAADTVPSVQADPAPGSAVVAEEAGVAEEDGLQRLHLPFVSQRQHRLRPSAWRPTAQVGGDVGVVATDGRYAFVRVGTRLTAVDLDDPANPVIVGESGFGQGMIHRVVHSGGFAYALGSDEVDDGPFGVGPDPDSGLRVYDVQDQSNPHQVGWLATAEHAWDLALAGDRVIVVDYEGTLYVVDVTVPAQPRVLTSLRLPGGAWSVAVDGSHAYVASRGLRVGGESHERQLHVVDLAVPDSPSHIASMPLSEASADMPVVAASKGYVFLSSGTVVDATDPTAPYVVAQLDTACDEDCSSLGVAVEGATLQIVNYDPGQGYPPVASDTRLLVVDVSQPWQPVPQSTTHMFRRHVSAFAATPDYVLLTAGSALHVVDVRDPIAPAEVGHLTVSIATSPSAVAVEGGRAYVIDEASMSVLDVSDPGRPHVEGVLPFRGTTMRTARNVTVWGRHAYIQTRYALHIADVSDPGRPLLISAVPGGINVALTGVVVTEGTAYLASWVDDRYAARAPEPGQVRVIDVGDPGAPADITVLPTNTNAVFAGAGRLFRSTLCGAGAPDDGGRYDCLDVWDISDPAQPRRLGEARLEHGQFVDGVLVGDHALVVVDGRLRYGEQAVVGDSARLLVFDVADPTRPAQIASRPLTYCPSGNAPRLRVADGKAWVAHACGVEEFDITNPARPTRIAAHPLPRSPSDLAVAGGSAYVAADGLWVFAVEPGTE